MDEQGLRSLMDQVRTRTLPRRQFIAGMVGVGLTVPMASGLLLHAGTQVTAYKPTRRGGGGTVRIIRSDGATLLNPHFATGLKDGFASRIFDEPLAERDADGNLIAVLAAAIPSRENGGLASDGQTVT